MSFEYLVRIIIFIEDSTNPMVFTNGLSLRVESQTWKHGVALAGGGLMGHGKVCTEKELCSEAWMETDQCR